MAEDAPTTTPATTQQNEGGVQVLLDERELRTFYANAYRIHTSS